MRRIDLNANQRYRARHPERVAAQQAAWREADPDYYLRRNIERRSLVATWKLERGCADCGYADDPVALDFDHLPGSTKVARVGAMMMASLETLLAEMEKCDVVCSNCHRIRTWERANA